MMTAYLDRPPLIFLSCVAIVSFFMPTHLHTRTHTHTRPSDHKRSRGHMKKQNEREKKKKANPPTSHHMPLLHFHSFFFFLLRPKQKTRNTHIPLSTSTILSLLPSLPSTIFY